MIRVRSQQQRAAKLESSQRQSELEQRKTALNDLQNEYRSAAEHCRHQLVRMPHLAAQYQAALGNLQTRIHAARHEFDIAEQRLREAQQRTIAANVALEQVQTIGEQLEQEWTQRLHRLQGQELLERLAAPTNPKSFGDNGNA